jgi:hypothetical protein
MRQQLLKNSRKSSRRKSMTLKATKNKKEASMLKTQQVDERCMNSNQLSIKTTCVKN